MELTSLKPLFDHPGPWASVYLDTSRATQDAKQQLDLRARAVLSRLDELGTDPRTRQALAEALVDLPVSGSPPGRALFAADGEVVLDRPLTASPPLPEVSWDVLPRLGPLPSLAEDQPRCLVAHVARTGARFELIGPLEHQEAGEVRGADWPVHRTGRNDWSERRFQIRVENTWEHNAGLIAEEIARTWPGCGADMLVLAGDPRERRSVHDRLPEQLRQVAVETGHGPVAKEIARARQQWLRARLDTALDRFRAGRGHPGGHGPDGAEPGAAAEGVPAVVGAARRRQIETLLMRPDGGDTQREVWVGPEPDQVGVQRQEVRAMGVTEPVPARADDALLRCGVAADARVLTVPEGTPEPAGGVGAVLRWIDGTA
jgi:Bacterial archaeo-eukaryotic release factor family 2